MHAHRHITSRPPGRRGRWTRTRPDRSASFPLGSRVLLSSRLWSRVLGGVLVSDPASPASVSSAATDGRDAHGPRQKNSRFYRAGICSPRVSAFFWPLAAVARWLWLGACTAAPTAHLSASRGTALAAASCPSMAAAGSVASPPVVSLALARLDSRADVTGLP